MIAVGITLLPKGRASASVRSGTMLFDADCGICVATAVWLAKRVAPRRLRLLALGDAASDGRIARLVAGRQLSASLHFVRADDTVLTGARAVLAAGRLVPRWRLLAIPFDNSIGHVVLEPVYRQVATHRRQIGRLLHLPASCPVPTGDQRPA